MRRMTQIALLLCAVGVNVRGAEPGVVEHVHDDADGNLVIEPVLTVVLPPTPLPAKWVGKGVSVAMPVPTQPTPTPTWQPVRNADQRSSATLARPALVPAAHIDSPLPAGSMSHAGDYSWLVGTLQYIHSRQLWTLRFAPLDRENRYGGSVTLKETGPLARFRSGQTVRVTGYLVDAGSNEPSPSFRISSIRAVE